MFDAFRGAVRDRLQYVTALIPKAKDNRPALLESEDRGMAVQSLVSQPGWKLFAQELESRRTALMRKWLDGPKEDGEAVRLAAKELECLAGWANRVMAAGADARQQLDAQVSVGDRHDG